MDLKRRIQLYAVGLVIGGGVAYSIYGDRITNGAWLPDAKIKQRLRSTLLKATTDADRQLAERSLQLGDLRLSMDSASVDLGDTRRTDDSIYYAVDTRLSGEDVRLTIATLRDFDRDSTATLVRISGKK